MKDGLKVAVVGATGAVGRELLGILNSREFPIRELVPFASPRSEGKAISWKEKSHRIRALKAGCFEGVQIAFFDAADAISREWALKAAEAGAWVVDNSSVFRLEEDIPLIVPEVNRGLLEARLKSSETLTPRERIISGPNCVAVPLSVALKPILDSFGLRRVVVSTYQSVSGAGSAAMEELSIQTVGMFNHKPVEPRVFPHQIAFNCIPHIGKFLEDGMTSEEEKIIAETRKLLGKSELGISATSVRVPTFSCHAMSVNLECESSFEIEAVRTALQNQAGIILQDRPQGNLYPLGMSSEGDVVEAATGKDAVYVGRVRRDTSVQNGLNLWIVSDNLRKGAALNAVQMGEVILKKLN